MIPHTQTIFGDGTEGATPGNCMQTAVASLLDLPLDDVPHFVAEPIETWWTEFLDWIFARGLRLTMFEDRFDEIEQYRGGDLITAPLSLAPADRLAIANGMTERGFRHSVLWQHGALVHDPHPSGAGLLDGPDEIWLLEPYYAPAIGETS